MYSRTYLHAFFHRSGVNSLLAHFVLVHREQTHTAAIRLIWTAVILNSSARLVDHCQTVGHLKCTVKWCTYIKSFGGQKGVQKGDLSEPPRTPLPTGLQSNHKICRKISPNFCVLLVFSLRQTSLLTVFIHAESTQSLPPAACGVKISFTVRSVPRFASIQHKEQC